MSVAAPGRLLVCTDLDRTVIPNGTRPESPAARRLFRALANRPEVRLCYVSGRHKALVDKAIVNYALPLPEFVIGDVGTTIYGVDSDDKWTPIDEWQSSIGADWGGRSRDELKGVLGDLPELRLQEYRKQNRFKLSYYVPVQVDVEDLRTRIATRLSAIDVRANQVFSIDEPAGIGLLDILPARASKLHAVEFLMRRLGFGEEDTVFCGDSGNDLEVLVSRLPAVLVANAAEAVRAAAVEQAKADGHADRLYLARGDFLGMNGNYAAGAIEGIAHYHPGIVDWLAEDIGAAPQ